MKRIICLAISSALACSILTGCPQNQQSIDASIVTIAGSTFAAVLTTQGHSAEATQILTLTGTVSTDIKKFVPGTTSQDTVQAIADADALASSFTDSNVIAYANIFIAALDGILQDYQIATPATTIFQPSFAVTVNPPIKTIADYKARFNSTLTTTPISGVQPIK